MEGASRVQDIVGPTFGDFKKSKPNSKGFRVVHFKAKKSEARRVSMSQEAYKAVVAYQDELRAPDDQVMLPPAAGPDPTINQAR